MSLITFEAENVSVGGFTGLRLSECSQASNIYLNLEGLVVWKVWWFGGLVFLLFAMETLGDLHAGAVTQVRQIAAALARSKGIEEGEVTGQLFGRLSLTLMRGNALVLSSRCQEDPLVPPPVDGIM